MEHWASNSGFKGYMAHLPELGISMWCMTNSWEGEEIGPMIRNWPVGRLASEAEGCNFSGQDIVTG